MQVGQQNVLFSCANYHTVVITGDKKVACWGKTAHELLNVPADLENVVAVSCGDDHAAALTEDRKVVCWGLNSDGQCDVPAHLENVIAISTGAHLHIPNPCSKP
jgi:alpha-tubulin suppressor-like RCC1 family protein